MARKVGQIVRRGSCTWLVRVYTGRHLETKKRTYLNQTIRGGLRDAQAHLNKMLGERDRGQKLDSSKQTLTRMAFPLPRFIEPRMAQCGAGNRLGITTEHRFCPTQVPLQDNDTPVARLLKQVIATGRPAELPWAPRPPHKGLSLQQ